MMCIWLQHIPQAPKLAGFGINGVFFWPGSIHASTAPLGPSSAISPYNAPPGYETSINPSGAEGRSASRASLRFLIIKRHDLRLVPFAPADPGQSASRSIDCCSPHSHIRPRAAKTSQYNICPIRKLDSDSGSVIFHRREQCLSNEFKFLRTVLADHTARF
jgi:hypothetical protein